MPSALYAQTLRLLRLLFSNSYRGLFITIGVFHLRTRWQLISELLAQ